MIDARVGDVARSRAFVWLEWTKLGSREMYIGGDLISGQVAILEILQARLGSSIFDHRKRLLLSFGPISQNEVQSSLPFIED